jgi:hypothetical protein
VKQRKLGKREKNKEGRGKEKGEKGREVARKRASAPRRSLALQNERVAGDQMFLQKHTHKV